jgi:membrane-bound serine protease (ClpP class)
MALLGSLHALLAVPDVAYILFIIGVVGVAGEINHPGTVAPGVVGAVALLLALVGFSALGVNWLAVALIILAAGLFVAEAHTSHVGLLALGGLVAFVAGSWLLFAPGPAIGPAPTPPGDRVSPWLIALGALGLGGYILVVVRAVLRTRRLPSATGVEALFGRDGVATSDLTPRGTVRVGGEEWSAVAEYARAPIKAGETVEVLAVDGVTLHVHRPYEWGVQGAPTL